MEPYSSFNAASQYPEERVKLTFTYIILCILNYNHKEKLIIAIIFNGSLENEKYNNTKKEVVIQKTDRPTIGSVNFPAKRLNNPKHPMMPRQPLHHAVKILVSD